MPEFAPPPQRPGIHPEAGGGVAQRQAIRQELLGLLVAHLAPGERRLLAPLRRCWPWRLDGSKAGLGRHFVRHLPRDPADDGMVPLHDGPHRVAQVAQHVPAIRDLAGSRGAGADTVGVGAGSVPGNDLDARVAAQPSCQRVGLPIRQQVDHGVALQVHEHRAVAVAAAQRPVVHPEHARRRARRRLRSGHQPQQGVRAGGHGEPRGEARTGLAAGGQGDLPLQVRQPPGPAGGCGHGVADALSEGPAGARRVGAAEPAGAQQEDDGATLPGQVEQAALVPAVNSAGRPVAGRTVGRGLAGRGDDGDAVGGGQDLLHEQARRNERELTSGHGIFGQAGRIPSDAKRQPSIPCPARKVRESPCFAQH